VAEGGDALLAWAARPSGIVRIACSRRLPRLLQPGLRIGFILGRTFRRLSRGLVPGFVVRNTLDPVSGVLTTTLAFVTRADASQDGDVFEVLFRNAAGKALTARATLRVTRNPR
jgi:hypothetical protein